MKKAILLPAILSYLGIYAQFTTPNTGTIYNLTSLSQVAPSTVVNNGDHFVISNNLTIAPNDQLIIDENTNIKLGKDVMLYIFGTYKSNVNQLTFTSQIDDQPYKGIRFEESSTVELKNTTIEKGGGIRVNTANFVMMNCVLKYNVNVSGGATSSAALQYGTVNNTLVKNSKFIENFGSAIGSGANISVSGTIDNNYFYANNTSNQNRPQINLGPAGSIGMTISNNEIIGSRNLIMTGGISASALVGGANNITIENNKIIDNRYGITVAGNSSYGVIRKNTIENNNTQNNPQLGGSGINFLGSGTAAMDIKVSENIIRGNLWGVTLQGTAQANFGSDQPGKENIGKNIFKDNGNLGALYALFNNTPNPIEAKFNCWREGEQSNDAMVEDVVSHQTDDASLGLVNFAAYQCSINQSVNDFSTNKTAVYPNPSNGQFRIKIVETSSVHIINLTGALVYSTTLDQGEHAISLKLNPGIYLINVKGKSQLSSSKLIIK